MSLAFSKNFLLQIDSNISLYRLKCKCIQEFFRPICLRVFEKLIWCFIFLYFSAFQKYDPVCDSSGELHFMGTICLATGTFSYWMIAQISPTIIAQITPANPSFTVNKAARSYIGKYLIINSQFIALPLSHDF